ncbi:hypothetical protein D9M70_482890 [compost metagenome]
MQTESSTVTPCGTPSCMSISVRPSVGRISDSLPCTRWLRLSLVAIFTVSAHWRSASCVRGVSGVAVEKLPPSPTKTLTLPSSIAAMVSTTS